MHWSYPMPSQVTRRTLSILVLSGLAFLAAPTLRAGAQPAGQPDRAADQPEKPADQPEKAPDATAKTEPPPEHGPVTIGSDLIDPNQAIKPQFLIHVLVAGEPDPSGDYRVDQAGNIYVRYAGSTSPVAVGSLTPAQAAAAVAKFLKAYINNPQVTVSIIEVPHPVVNLIGPGVRLQGAVIIGAQTTLSDLLARADILDSADLAHVRIIRTVDGQSQVLTFHYDRFLRPDTDQLPDLTQNPLLKNDDRVLVPTKASAGNTSNTISVYGEVVKPQQKVILTTAPSMTVRDAVNLAGGPTTTANHGAVSIHRLGVDRPILVDLDKAEIDDPVNNIDLKPDDIVYVERVERKAFINMDGGFVKPGKLVYDKPYTLTEAISEVGGPAQFARVWQGVVFRHPDDDPRHTRVIAFNFNNLKKGKSQDFSLEPGDAVIIPPGVAPRPALDIYSALSILSSSAYLYSAFSGNSFTTRP